MLVGHLPERERAAGTVPAAEEPCIRALADGRADLLCPGRACGTIATVPTLRLTQDAAADELLGRDPLALLLGMLFDQHMGGRSS